MDNKVPYIVFEGEMVRHERTIKRLIMTVIVTVALLFASNIAWLMFFNTFDVESTEVTLDSHEQGNATYVGQSGVVDNGRSEGE